MELLIAMYRCSCRGMALGTALMAHAPQICIVRVTCFTVKHFSICQIRIANKNIYCDHE